MNSTSKLFVFLFVMLFSVSCASTKTTSTNSDATPSKNKPATEAAEVTATNNWYLTPTNASPYYGTGVEKAYAELLAEKSPKEKVIVAIIDSGTDIDHEDLAGNIWVNKGEIPGNNIDDDKNGYVDDVHGWNFIGGPDGKNVDKDTYEATRLYAKMRGKYEGVDEDSVAAENLDEYKKFQKIKAEYERRYQSNERDIAQVGQTQQAIQFAKQTLHVTNFDSVSMKDLEITESDTPQIQQAKQILTYLKNNGAKESDLADLKNYYKHVTDLKKYGLNPDFNPRNIVGDDYEDLSDRYYGNNDVKGPSNDHGTHVAGIVGAVRDNNLGTVGIANNVELMIVRAVPDGDERDKDVANAIRYAADNGARVMNMSFGKGFSPYKEYVDAAIQHADSLGVLMIAAAGNESTNVDSSKHYPTPDYINGGSASNYITVGALSWKTDSTLVAGFSNYGAHSVDLFAPGVDIYSTYPDNTYKMESGTSMASPVVTGIAALIMSYYPELSAHQVKNIILQSVTKIDRPVYKPGTQQAVPFSQLSRTGGVVNVYNALKLAEEQSNP
jgi:subtilisin family serine protease